MRIALVIDDDPDVSRVVSLMLRSASFEVVSAQNESDALEVINGSAALDIAIVDFWLGSQTSLAVLEALEASRPNLPVLVISGGGGGVPLEVTHSVSRLEGAASFIQKPFSREDLISEVNSVLP